MAVRVRVHPEQAATPFGPRAEILHGGPLSPQKINMYVGAKYPQHPRTGALKKASQDPYSRNSAFLGKLYLKKV